MMRRIWGILACTLLVSCASPVSQSVDSVFEYSGGRVTVLDDYGDCFISIRGAIDKSLEPAFNNAIKNVGQKNCIETIVILHSHGGDLATAMHIGKEIRENNFSTDMHGFCESACVFTYIGGVRRFAHQNSRINKDSELGVHQPSSELLMQQCVWDPNKDILIIQKINQYLAQMLPKTARDALSKVMFGTSCKKVNYIDANFLLDSGIATEKVDFH